VKLRVAALLLAACKASSGAPPEAGEISVPKMPPDASSGLAAPDASSAAAPIIFGAEHGWHFEGEQLQPKYVEAKLLVPELTTAWRAGNLVVGTTDEKIEECSSAGGSHVLFKTSMGLVHWGGHGVYLQPGPAKGQTIVLAFEKLAAPESIEKSAFCVPARTIVARAKVVLEVADFAAGERMIADLGR
jgi:hypothetical protein